MRLPTHNSSSHTSFVDLAVTFHSLTRRERMWNHRDQPEDSSNSLNCSSIVSGPNRPMRLF